jgi:hypothetical protein
MGDSANNNTQSIADYLAQLLKDKKQLAAFPNVFLHLERLLDDGKNGEIIFYLHCCCLEYMHARGHTFYA